MGGRGLDDLHQHITQLLVIERMTLCPLTMWNLWEREADSPAWRRVHSNMIRSFVIECRVWTLSGCLMSYDLWECCSLLPTCSSLWLLIKGFRSFRGLELKAHFSDFSDLISQWKIFIWMNEIQYCSAFFNTAMDMQWDEQDVPLQWAWQLNTKQMIQAVTLISLENEEKCQEESPAQLERLWLAKVHTTQLFCPFVLDMVESRKKI